MGARQRPERRLEAGQRFQLRASGGPERESTDHATRVAGSERLSASGMLAFGRRLRRLDHHRMAECRWAGLGWLETKCIVFKSLW